MWNPKALKHHKPRREWGPEDESAASEGAAVRGLSQLRPANIRGKGTLKDQTREGRGEQIQENHVTKRYL